jgi:hypothetical protein
LVVSNFLWQSLLLFLDVQNKSQMLKRGNADIDVHGQLHHINRIPKILLDFGLFLAQCP